MEKFELWRSGMEDKGLKELTWTRDRYWYVVLNHVQSGKPLRQMAV